jgi:hypothetical protein
MISAFAGLAFTADLTASRRNISRLKVGMIIENDDWIAILLQALRENFSKFSY